jgi:siroheme synthase-like protein
MIVDLRLDSKRVLVVGGGREATKRVTAMGKENCAITVVSPVLSDVILEMAESGRITAVRERAGVSIVERMHPDVVVAATDDHPLNRSLVTEARRRRILGYSSSDPQCSDYAHLAQAEFDGAVRVAVSTGGKSPAAAKIIRDEIRRAMGGIITPRLLQNIEERGRERMQDAKEVAR